jgi:RNA polymerase sigma-70 factor, ECF subfamily
MAARNEEMERRLSQGDMDALHWVVETYQDAMLRLGWRFFGRAAEAQDFAQDVFVRLYEQRHHYNPDRPLQPWLYTVAANLGREHLRRHREIPMGDDLPALTVNAEAEDRVLQDEQRRHVLQLLQTLQPKHREVLALRFESGLSLQEIAQVLKAPLGTIKSRLSRGLEEFHEAYQHAERSWSHE